MECVRIFPEIQKGRVHARNDFHRTAPKTVSGIGRLHVMYTNAVGIGGVYISVLCWLLTCF